MMHSTAAGLSSACAYGAVSMSITLFNKVVLRYGFSFPLSLLLAQNLITLTVFGALSITGWVSLPKLSIGAMLRLLPLSICFIASAFLGLASLDGLHIPMYNVLKRITSLPTMILERIFLKKVPSGVTCFAVFLVIGGALIAGIGDIHFDLAAYTLAFASCVATAAYFTSVSLVGNAAKLSSVSLLFYNAMLTTPLLLLVVVWSGEARAVWEFPALMERGFVIAVLLSLLFGTMLTYTQFLCTQCNSPLTTTIVGQIKVVISTILSYIVFGGHINQATVFGTIINTTGGFLYVYSKWTAQQKPEKTKTP